MHVHAASTAVVKEPAMAVPTQDPAVNNPFAKGIQFRAKFVSSVKVRSQRDDKKVREMVTEAILANEPSLDVVFIIKLNTLRIKLIKENTNVDYLMSRVVYCGAHADFKDTFFFIHRSKHDRSLFAEIYKLSDSDKVKLLTLAITKAFQISYEGWSEHVKKREQEIPTENSIDAEDEDTRKMRARSIPQGVLDRHSTDPWPPKCKDGMKHRSSFGDKSQLPTGNPAVYKVQAVDPRTDSIHHVSLTADMDREFRELAESRSNPSFLSTDLPSTEIIQFDLRDILHKETH